MWYNKDLHGKEGKAQVHESWRGYTRRSKTNPNFQHVEINLTGSVNMGCHNRV